MALSVFDKATAKILSKAFSFDVHYDTDKEGKKNAKIDVPEFSLGGLRWKLLVRPDADDGTHPFGLWLKLSEECERAMADGYKVQVRNERVFTADSGEVSEKKTMDDLFTCDVLHLVNFDGAIVHYDMTINLRPEDIHPYRLQFVDEAVAKKMKYDCKVILEDDEDKVIFVNKVVLSLNSPFFDILFFGGFKEKRQKTMKLSEVTEVEFLEYLYCVYTPCRSLAFKRLEVLLCLADRFQNDGLLGTIETFLSDKLEKKNISSEEKCQALVWADAYRMPTLFAEIVESLDKKELGSLDVTKCTEFTEWNSKILMKRLIEGYSSS